MGEETSNGLIVVILALAAVLFLAMLLAGGEAMAAHNQAMAELVFSEERLPLELTEEEREAVLWMREQIAALKTFHEARTEEQTPDLLRIQAMYFALFFGYTESPLSLEAFYQCFQKEDGRKAEMETVYESLGVLLGRELTDDEIINATELYYGLQYGFSPPGYDDGFGDWMNQLPGAAEGEGVIPDGRCHSPVAMNWKRVVSSEFGLRNDPVSGVKKGHAGIDLAIPTGSRVYSAWDGTVQAVRYSKSGYGYHVIVNHGNGVVTLYAHCSKLLVSEGAKVSQGDVIALSGNTGKSTGPHLHFEVRVYGEARNPRLVLP